MDQPAETVLLPVRIQELLLETPDLEDFLASLAVLLAERLGRSHVSAASLMVVRPRRRPLVVASTPGFTDLQQDLHAEDPARLVLGNGAPAVVRSPGLPGTPSRYWDGLNGQGVAAAAAVPVPVPPADPADAVLTCYSSSAGAFGPGGMHAVASAAAALAAPLALALRLDAQTHRARNLQAALESRTVVDLAAGIIMAQNNCSQQSAVEILRSVSNSRNVKVREVAAGVVAVVSDRVSTHFEE